MSRQLDSIKIIEMKKERCIELSETLPDNVIVVNGDGRDSDTLAEESVKDYDAFVAVHEQHRDKHTDMCRRKEAWCRQDDCGSGESRIHQAGRREWGVDAVINKKTHNSRKDFQVHTERQGAFREIHERHQC